MAGWDICGPNGKINFWVVPMHDLQLTALADQRKVARNVMLGVNFQTRLHSKCLLKYAGKECRPGMSNPLPTRLCYAARNCKLHVCGKDCTVITGNRYITNCGTPPRGGGGGEKYQKNPVPLLIYTLTERQSMWLYPNINKTVQYISVSISNTKRNEHPPNTQTRS